MRYIGQVYKTIAAKDLNHLKTFLEREALVRSVKHLFNEKLRDTPDSHLSKVLAHLFNILLAPQPLIEKLDSGVISYPVSEPVAVLPPSNTSVPKVAEAQTEEESKKKSKKAKKSKQEKAGTVEGGEESKSQSEKKKPVDLGEMLLKTSGAELQPFAVEGLFIEPQVFKGLYHIEEPAVLRQKPAELYEQIRKVALHRYSMELPVNQKDLLCMKKANTKLAVLRDICLKIGVKLISHDYNLDNDIDLQQASQQKSNVQIGKGGKR